MYIGVLNLQGTAQQVGEEGKNKLGPSKCDVNWLVGVFPFFLEGPGDKGGFPDSTAFFKAPL